MNSSSPFRHRKGQAIAFDASFAAVLALTVVLLGVSAVSTVAENAAQHQDELSKQAKAIALADYLIKEGAAFTEGSSYGTIAHTHEIDEGRLRAASIPRGSCAEFISQGRGFCSGAACVMRPAVIHGSNEAGYLHVCIE